MKNRNRLSILLLVVPFTFIAIGISNAGDDDAPKPKPKPVEDGMSDGKTTRKDLENCVKENWPNARIERKPFFTSCCTKDYSKCVVCEGDDIDECYTLIKPGDIRRLKIRKGTLSPSKVAPEPSSPRRLPGKYSLESAPTQVAPK